MTGAKRYFLNGAALALSALLLRAIGVIWNAYLAKKLGAAGMGLISLTMSVYTLAVTFATSSVNFAATTMIAEATARNDKKAARGAMKACVCQCLVTGSAACFILTLAADFIGNEWLGDPGTVLSLRLLGMSLPFIAISSALSGYFTAVRKAYKNAAVQVLEQTVKMALTFTALGALLPDGAGTEYMCAAVVGGAAFAEAASLAVNALLYALDRARLRGVFDSGPDSAVFKKLFSITIPISASAYARSGFLTLEHMLIPRGLRKYGADYNTALASYGILHGMAMPVVLFPASILGAFSSLLVPELAEAAALGDTARVRRITAKSLFAATLYSSVAAIIMTAVSGVAGEGLYGSAEAGGYIALMAPLIPIMYVDVTIDSVLKGLGEQLCSMKINIVDSAVSAALVWLLLPKLGITGYVITIYVSETLNTALSAARLIRLGALTLPGFPARSRKKLTGA